MNLSITNKLLRNQIIANRLIYKPVFLMGPLMVALIYVIFSISDMVAAGAHFAGARTMVGTVFTTLSYVFGIISLFIFFYLNSFLMGRRRKTFGLYAVLGLDKHDLVKLTTLELILLAVYMIVVGVILGIALSYLAYHVFSQIMQGKELAFDYFVSTKAICKTAILYLAIFTILLIFSSINIIKSKITELLAAEEKGEREPKTRWLIAIGSIAMLIFAFYLANKDMEAQEAILLFPIAVLLVIVATYGIFIGGIILILKALKKNQGIYYKPRNFINISNLIFRMKANGTGLATVSILFTCAILTFSVTSSLYFGLDKFIEKHYNRDVVYTYNFNLESTDEDNLKQKIDENFGIKIRDYTDACSEKLGVKIEDPIYRVEYLHPQTWQKKELEENTVIEPEADEFSIYYAYNLNKEDSEAYQADYIDEIMKEIYQQNQGPQKIINEGDLKAVLTYFNIENGREFQNLLEAAFGSLFFIGIYFIFFFILTSGLVMYFKQLGEAYADRPRYLILQELGLDQKQVKGTIRSQVLLMFFLPLAFSVINVLASYKILWLFLKTLTNGQFFNSQYFLTMSAVSVGVFTLIYFLLYMISNRSYYKIVQR